MFFCAHTAESPGTVTEVVAVPSLGNGGGPLCTLLLHTHMPLSLFRVFAVSVFPGFIEIKCTYITVSV